MERADGWEVSGKGGVGWVPAEQTRQIFNVPKRMDKSDMRERPSLDERPTSAIARFRSASGSPIRGPGPPPRTARSPSARSLSPPVQLNASDPWSVERYGRSRSASPERRWQVDDDYVLKPEDNVERGGHLRQPSSRGQGRQRHQVLYELQQLLTGRPQRELEEMARILRSAGNE